MSLSEEWQRTFVLLHGLERGEKYRDMLKEWVNESKDTFTRWFRETFANPFLWSPYISIEDALKDKIFMKSIYDKMYRPDLYNPKITFESFYEKVLREKQ